MDGMLEWEAGTGWETGLEWYCWWMGNWSHWAAGHPAVPLLLNRRSGPLIGIRAQTRTTILSSEPPVPDCVFRLAMAGREYQRCEHFDRDSVSTLANYDYTFFRDLSAIPP